MADPQLTTTRIPISIRTRFEVFKRDDFCCVYCGRSVPDVVLQVDHVVPVVEGGTNDLLNLVTACADCNSGKAGVPLNRVLDIVDPAAMAADLLAQEQAIRDYNQAVLNRAARMAADRQSVYEYFIGATGWSCMRPDDFNWLMSVVEDVPVEVVLERIDAAERSGAPKRAWIPYLKTCIRRWREAGY